MAAPMPLAPGSLRGATNVPCGTSSARRWIVAATPTRLNQAAGQPEPEDGSGWAPPPWKRKVTYPLSTITTGQEMAGLVRNVVDFGAFIDVGAERDGFAHVKDLSTEFVYAATDMLRPGQAVRAWVKYVDAESSKLGLALVDPAFGVDQGAPEDGGARKMTLEAFQDVDEEMFLEGRVTRITNFGAFIDVGCEVDAFLHTMGLPKRKGQNTRVTLDDLVCGRTIPVRVTEVNLGLRRLKVSARAVDDVDMVRERFAGPSSQSDVFARGPKE